MGKIKYKFEVWVVGYDKAEFREYKVGDVEVFKCSEYDQKKSKY